MLTIDEAIARFEANAEQNERWANAGLNPEANAEYAAEHRQLAAWLQELQERRKAPEIITCGECRWYGRANKQRFYRGMDCLQRRMSTVVPDKDFCSKAEKAERRTDD